jgi:hypothetical protein
MVSASLQLSLRIDDGECNEIPVVVNGLFYADESGHWSSNTSFSYNKALYGAYLNSLRFTSEDWSRAFERLVEKMSFQTMKMPERDYAWNAVIFITFTLLYFLLVVARKPLLSGSVVFFFFYNKNFSLEK